MMATSDAHVVLHTLVLRFLLGFLLMQEGNALKIPEHAVSLENVQSRLCSDTVLGKTSVVSVSKNPSGTTAGSLSFLPCFYTFSC